MRMLSMLLIVVGIMVLSYPSLAEEYHDYQQQKLVREWKDSLHNIHNGGDAMSLLILSAGFFYVTNDRKHGETAILLGSFTPIPFKLFTIMSGCMNYSFWKLFGYAAIGRAAKFYVVGMLFYLYGRAAENMVDGAFSMILAGLGILLSVCLLLIRRYRKRKMVEHKVEG